MIGTKFDAGSPGAIDPVERVSSRPDFNILVYPWYRPGAMRPTEPQPFPIPADAPPVMIRTDDYRSHVEPTVEFYLELRARRIPAEMSIYASGCHGFGLRPTKRPSPVIVGVDARARHPRPAG